MVKERFRLRAKIPSGPQTPLCLNIVTHEIKITSLGAAFLTAHKDSAQYKDLPFLWGELHLAAPGSCRTSIAEGRGTMYLEKLAGDFQKSSG